MPVLELLVVKYQAQALPASVLVRLGHPSRALATLSPLTGGEREAKGVRTNDLPY